MTTTWTHDAILSLKGHYEFHKKAKGVPFARAWRKKFLTGWNPCYRFHVMEDKKQVGCTQAKNFVLYLMENTASFMK